MNSSAQQKGFKFPSFSAIEVIENEGSTHKNFQCELVTFELSILPPKNQFSGESGSKISVQNC